MPTSPTETSFSYVYLSVNSVNIMAIDSKAQASFFFSVSLSDKDFDSESMRKGPEVWLKYLHSLFWVF